MNEIIYWKNPTRDRVLILRRKESTIVSPACKGCYFDNEKNIPSELCNQYNFHDLKYPDCDSNNYIFELIDVKHYKDFEKCSIMFSMHYMKYEKPTIGQEVLIFTNKSGFNIASLTNHNSWRRKPSAKSHLCVSDSDRWIELEKLNVINNR